MKTKIIYISGSEVFDAADIRAAFNEVRMTLGLASDIVLFGVPVDSDDAGLSTTPQTTVEDTAANIDTPDADPVTDDIAQEIQIMDETTPVAPVKKTRKTTRAKSEPVLETIVTPEEPVTENITPQIDIVAQPVDEPTAEKVIPILSILSSNKDTENAPVAADPAPDVDPLDTIDLGETKADVETDDSGEDSDTTEFDNVVIEDVDPLDDVEPEPVTQSVRIESVSVEHITIDNDDAGETITTQSVTIEEMMTDDMPEAEEEKTLERLLEKMTPLREDTPDDQDTGIIQSEPEIIPEPAEQPDLEQDYDQTGIDATLEQLATEFVEKQDQIDVTPKTETTGKIGKLKNILPFKKAKREEPGLMGDLFGWAGIAANDDEFSIPGFFTTSASKK